MSERLGNSKDRDAMRFIVIHSTKEMELSNRQLEERLKASKREIVMLQENLKAVHTESLTDPLMQSANQKFFDAALEAACADAHSKNESLSLMMTDNDRFKNFNDNYGHLTGNQVSTASRSCIRNEQRQGSGHRARYEGEEFAINLPNALLHSAITVADHIRRAVMTKELTKRSTGEHLGRATISIGKSTPCTGST
jgi:diguanylate cyclase